jgi:DNA ligase-1
VLFAELAHCSTEVASTRSRNQKRALLARCIAQLEAAELAVGVALLAGSMRQGRIGLGYRAVMDVKAPSASAPELTVAEVDAGLSAIAEAKGAGSAASKRRLLGQLLGRATEVEQTFVRRIIVGELRQGALEALLLEAVAEASGTALAAVRRAHMLCGELGAVAEAAMLEGEPGLGRFRLQLFRPLEPMLAQTCDHPADAVSRFGEVALEAKIDGARIQVHKRGDEVAIYSRGLKDVTIALPEVVERVRVLAARELILDGEVIALAAGGRPHPFQTTMRRFGRKLDVPAMREQLPLSPYFFDVLAADGELLDRPARERFAAMADLLPADTIIPRCVVSDAEQAEQFMADVLDAGHEGVMAKALASSYEAGSRGGDWLKIKPAHTLDLVVLAAEWGSGRRNGWLSNLHLGARNDDGSFTMLGKTFKGMTDETLRFQTEALERIALAREGHVVHVRPELVVEIAFSDVQTSPHYPGGVALRFARLKRYRPDKSAAQADTLHTVLAIHQKTHHR